MRSETAGRLYSARRWSALLVCCLLLALGLVLSVALGPVLLELSDVLAGLLGSASSVARRIVWNLRLPRALVGGLVGANLAVAGVLLQGIMRNPLAAPNIVGVTAGAGLAATLMMIVLPAAALLLPTAAFAGALAASLLVYAISWQPGCGTSPVRMVLAGVAMTSMLGAFTTFLMVTYSDRVQPIVMWMSGSLVGRSWDHAALIWPYSLVGLAVALVLVRALNIMQLGDEAAASLGVRTELIRFAALAAAALLAGSAVSVAGLVGFVGLIVPHVMRLMLGGNHLVLVPASALGGALLIVWADLVARLMSELPVGVLTAMLGGPFFVYLLYRRKLL